MYVCLFTSSESLGCMVNTQYIIAAEAFYPLWHAEWSCVEQYGASLISPQAMAGRTVVGGWWILVPGYIMVGQGSMGVKDNTLPSLLNQMQIKLKSSRAANPSYNSEPLDPAQSPIPLPLSFTPSAPPPLFIPLFFRLIVLATELRERTRGGDGCLEAFTTKII